MTTRHTGAGPESSSAALIRPDITSAAFDITAALIVVLDARAGSSVSTPPASD